MISTYNITLVRLKKKADHSDRAAGVTFVRTTTEMKHCLVKALILFHGH